MYVPYKYWEFRKCHWNFRRERNHGKGSSERLRTRAESKDGGLSIPPARSCPSHHTASWAGCLRRAVNRAQKGSLRNGVKCKHKKCRGNTAASPPLEMLWLPFLGAVEAVSAFLVQIWERRLGNQLSFSCTFLLLWWGQHSLPQAYLPKQYQIHKSSAYNPPSREVVLGSFALSSQLIQTISYFGENLPVFFWQYDDCSIFCGFPPQGRSQAPCYKRRSFQTL